MGRAEWRSFLNDAGAVFNGEQTSHFSNLRQEPKGDLVVDLSHLGLIAVDGAHTAAFLQGQLTNDIRDVSKVRSQLSAYCSPKGRVLASLLVFLRGERYFLQLPWELLDATLKRLRLFVLRADVALVDASESLVRIGLSGWNAHAKLQQMLGALPTTDYDVVQPSSFTVVRVRGDRPRSEILGPVGPMKQLWTALSEVARPAAGSAWSLLDIHSGIPTISPQTSDAFVPQMLNWDLLSGISFTKGCYTGQEIVARTQHLGRIKRRLYRARVAGASNVRPAMPLIVRDNHDSRNVGQVVNAEPLAEDSWELLGVIATEEAERATIYLQDNCGPALHLQALPYSLESGIST